MKHKQASESILIGVVLALAGGFMDAYSYMCRGHVFANAQTGNMLLMGINFSEGNFHAALKYMVPILAFTLGIGIADVAKYHGRNKWKLHWRQYTVLAEMLVLMGVMFIPQRLNLIANSLTSFACGMQVQSFRKINGSAVATTMCIGNIRSATQSFLEYRYTGDKRSLKSSLLYVAIILTFIVGAIFGNLMVNILSEKAMAVCVLILGAAFGIMFVDSQKTSESD